MNILPLKTSSVSEMIDLTHEIQKAVSSSGIHQGFCLIYVPHTTAAVTINENADADVQSDILMALEKIVPENLPYRHGEGNSPAHTKAGLIGTSEILMIENGSLALGTWQGVFFCEFDGPRNRKVYIQITGK